MPQALIQAPTLPLTRPPSSGVNKVYADALSKLNIFSLDHPGQLSSLREERKYPTQEGITNRGYIGTYDA